MVCGLLKPESGEGEVLGFDVLAESLKIKERVGYMTQKFSLYEDLSIRENLDFIGRLFELPERRRAVDANGFGNQPATVGGTPSPNHNFHFTSEVKYWFTYRNTAQPQLDFTGDDRLMTRALDPIEMRLGWLDPAPREHIVEITACRDGEHIPDAWITIEVDENLPE